MEFENGERCHGLPSDFRPPNSQLLIPATCVASANPLRLHSLDKLVKASSGMGSMERDD